MYWWQQLKRWVMELLHIEPSFVPLSEKVFMPLFYLNAEGKPEHTWNHLNKSDESRAFCREMILNMKKIGETPAICFLLTPPNEAGGIWDEFPNKLNQVKLDAVIAELRENCFLGISNVGTLYTDDKAPWFFAIEDHKAAWSSLHSQIGPYVSAYCLSIESNEQCRTVSDLQHYIHLMRLAMPGKQYLTHLQWQGKGAGGYQWTGGASTPANVDGILVEFSWNVDSGDKAGVAGVQSEMLIITANNKDKKLIFHEWSNNPGSETFAAQRERLRYYEPWGVG